MTKQFTTTKRVSIVTGNPLWTVTIPSGHSMTVTRKYSREAGRNGYWCRGVWFPTLAEVAEFLEGWKS